MIENKRELTDVLTKTCITTKILKLTITRPLLPTINSKLNYLGYLWMCVYMNIRLYCLQLVYIHYRRMTTWTTYTQSFVIWFSFGRLSLKINFTSITVSFFTRCVHFCWSQTYPSTTRTYTISHTMSARDATYWPLSPRTPSRIFNRQIITINVLESLFAFISM